MAKVVAKDLSKIYPGNVKAVDNISFEIEDKEFVVLVGPSGCGKTSTLRMLAGLESISTGELMIEDVVVNKLPPKDRNISMVFQNYALYPHMTVYKNMAFGLKLRKMKKELIDERVNDVSKILEIGDILERRPKLLSGGERQRVAVGRAIVRKPKVFLFDEPLSNLDAKLRVQMRGEISKLHTKLQSTMIYVTHDQVEAMTMGDRIIIMNEGVIQQNDSPMNIYRNPANKFVAGFIGSPPMNFIELNVTGKEKELYLTSEDKEINIKLPDSRVQALEGYINKKVILGIRPEDILEHEGSDKENYGTLDTLVEVVEPIGAEIYVYVTIAKNTLTARVASDHKIKVNDQFKVIFDMRKIHIFDYDTGRTLK